MTTTDPSPWAEDALDRRTSDNARDADSNRRLARICMCERRSQEAAEHYARILHADGRDAEALYNLAIFNLERAEYRQAALLLQTLLSVEPGNRMARYHVKALLALNEAQGRSTSKLVELYERIAHAEDGSLALGLRRELIPCLIEMNGDPLWVPGDLLRFLWHTVRKPITSSTPSFLAETEHYVWVRERLSPGDAVLDIGSNLGIFATMMGARVGKDGRVFAFEPSARIASDLRRVLALNELHQVTVIEAAASNRNGEAAFCDIQEGDVRREASHLSDPDLDRVLGGLRQDSISVKTLVIDDFVAEHDLRPALMKIDVEGAEFLVLEGARKTIGAHKPKLVIEIHANSEGVFDHGRLTDYLEKFGYQYKNESKTYFCW